jgi:membrane-bound serine protease (ClpP class)
MISAIILLLIGFGLIFIEFYLPGGIMGIIGGVVIAWAIIVFANASESPIATFAFVIASIVAFILMIKYILWKIPHTKSKYSIYSADNQEGYYASKKLPNVIGRTATALTDLRPGGYIDIDGQRIQAISQYGYIDKGSEVEVIAQTEESLIVKIKR